MPLLTDLSSEICEGNTCDDSNNNNCVYPRTMSDLSEFLVFPKHLPSMSLVIENDKKITNGCFVKLTKIKIPKTGKSVTPRLVYRFKRESSNYSYQRVGHKNENKIATKNCSVALVRLQSFEYRKPPDSDKKTCCKMDDNISSPSKEPMDVKLSKSQNVTCDLLVLPTASTPFEVSEIAPIDQTNGAVSNSVDPDSDDNSSITSGISIHAPSFTDMFDSPDRNDCRSTTKNENNELDPKKYRIPKLKCVAETQAVVSEASTSFSTEGVMLGSIPSTLPQPLSSSGLAQKHKEKHKDDRILKSTNKNKFVQPKETGNNDKPKENALKLPLMSSNSKRPTPKERLKPHSKSNKKAKDISSLQKSTEHTSETKTNMRPSQDLREGLRSTIDLKHMDKIMINPVPELLPQPASPPTNQRLECLINTDENYRRYQDATMRLFEQPCVDFLHRKPCSTVRCRYNHKMPNRTAVFIKMEKLPDDQIQFIYDIFINKYPLAFCEYFSVICRLYGMRKMRSKFAALVKDCERYEKFEYFDSIYDGLLLCDMSKIDALMTIVRCSQTCCASDEVILKIVQRDPLSFLDILCNYAAKLDIDLMNTLMDQVSKTCNVNVFTTFVNLLQRIAAVNVCLIDDIDKDVRESFCRAICQNVPNLVEKLLSILT